MRFGYRVKLIFIAIGSLIGLFSFLYSNYIASELAIKEKHEIKLWARAISLQNRFDTRSQIESQVILEITNTSITIPAIMTDEYLRVVGYQDIDTTILADSDKLRATLEYMSSQGRTPIRVSSPTGYNYTVYYDDSTLLKGTYFFPYIQLSVIGVFTVFAFITFSSSKHNEQNRVWVGLAKETAHQLGTPTSSLLGWIEYLRTQPLPPDVVDDMSKDVTRLTKVVDRFSKIGSTTMLQPKNICEVVSTTVDYFQSRTPRGVTLRFERQSDAPMQALINEALFEWVLENLLKNALDALGGSGAVTVDLSATENRIRIDVTDSGKGIATRNFRRIFHAGYTTKTRGWGLGLSLSKRIVSEYHKGKIYVLRSELDKGTTIRIALNRF